MKKFLFATLTLVFAFSLFSFIASSDKKPAWEIPAKYKTMKNQKKGDKASIALGKTLYGKHCKSCHGNVGLGDGPKAANLETFPGDFSDAKWQAAYTDGELYYMTIFGRDEMPKYDGKIPDEEGRWAVVNYVRSLKK